MCLHLGDSWAGNVAAKRWEGAAEVRRGADRNADGESEGGHLVQEECSLCHLSDSP